MDQGNPPATGQAPVTAPQHPGSPAGQGGQGWQPVPRQPAPPPYGNPPQSGQPLPGGYAPPPGGPVPAPGGYPPPAPRPPRRWPGTLALALAALLVVAVAAQTWLLVAVRGELGDANQRLDALARDQAYAAERLDALEGRASELERQAGEAFDPESIADVVLPSVFKVAAGDFTGTAFAVGSTDPEGTNLFTNYHVVEQVWRSGGREITLERTSQRYPAEIVDVEPESDLAWLRTPHSFNSLAASDDAVRSGQPIVAVGAPLGLTDTVTTGVVSSPAQQLPDGSGPWIQFDAAINPGNSGGPVINSDQEVVGIATIKGREAEGLGFAVPIDVACERFGVC